VKGRKNGATSAAGLRARAEERLRERRHREAIRSPSQADTAKLVHELQVHQIELEMQNEELLRSRAELEAALERYSELYDLAPVGYFTLDRDGTIRQANLTGPGQLGVARSELLGRRFGMFVAAADRSTFNDLLAKAFESHVMESCEVALAPQAGAARQPLHAQLTASVSEGAGECRAVVVDVTERKRAEEQLRAWAKMESIGRLAGGVAHDFNNLLAVILSHAALALEAVGEDAPLRADLLEVRAAAERATVLTRQLLAFGRKQVLRPELVDANELVRGLATMFRRLLGAHIELVLALADDLGQVRVDPAQLEQVIMNLAINARDAMPDGGKLTLSTANVDLDAVRAARWPMGRPGPFVLVAVNDTGVGMDRATREHIFEPFFTTKEKDRGTGFGLSTVHGIVKQFGGDVSFHSEPGRGTTFEVYLPCEAASSKRNSMVVARAKADVGGTETVLILEDEEPLRKVTKRILASAGYNVLVAASGAEALQLCERHSGPIHLALSDVVMPKMTGLAFAAHLKSVRPETRVLYMSGYAEEAIDKHGVLDPAMYIGKPFTLDALKRKVREVLDLPQQVVGAEQSHGR
jgi:PAS domain S-box-containing protein